MSQVTPPNMTDLVDSSVDDIEYEEDCFPTKDELIQTLAANKGYMAVLEKYLENVDGLLNANIEKERVVRRAAFPLPT